MARAVTPLGPIHSLDALERTESALLELLAGISDAEWDAPTIVSAWRVRHVAAHLLDTALRKLSVVRDGFAVERPASGSARDVRIFVDRLNAEGVALYSRLSADVLRALMTWASREYVAFHRQLDPTQPAVFAVSWAGEDTSLNWFDTARELTERWHHQAQIRLALNRPAFTTREVYHPVLDCFMRVLPHTYREVPAPDGSHVLFRVDGEAGGEWPLYRESSRWLLTRDVDDPPLAVVTIPEAIAWRLFTKGLDRATAERQIAIEGDRDIAGRVFDAVAIVG